MKPTAFLRAFLATVSSALILNSAAYADTLYFDGGGTTTTGIGWGTPSAWSTDLAGTIDATAAPTSADDVIFSITGAAAGVVGMNADRAANSLTFTTSTATTLQSHTTSTTSFKLTLGSGGITINSGAGAVTIGNSARGTLTTTLGASQSWTHNGSNAFSVIQPVNLGSNTLTLAGSGAGTVSISGKISGTGGMIMNKTGGAVTLSGANDFSGGFTLSNGRVENITGAYAGFGSGTLTLNGGNMHFSGSSTIANDMIWNGGLQFSRPGTGTPIVTFNGDAELTGDFAISQSATQPVSGVVFNGGISATGTTKLLTLSQNTAYTIAGSISGTVALTKNGTNTLTMTGANNYSGLTTVSDGTVIMTKPSTMGGLTVASGKTFVYAPTTAGALNVNGALTLGSAVTANTALGGTLSQSVIASTGAATMSGTGVVNIRLSDGATPAVGTHNLITAASGLTGGTYTLSRVFNNTNFTVSNFTRSATTISVDVASTTAISGNVYWKGGLTGTTGVWSATNGSTQSNWQVTDGVNQGLAPGATADLVFSTATSPGTMAGMTLGANMTIQSLTINNTATAFSLNADGFGTNNTLTITPSSSSTGITIGAGVQASSISAPIILGAAQTWTNNSANALTINSTVNNGGNTLIVTGSGTTTFGSAAAAVISGAGGVTMNGTGRLFLGAGQVPVHTYSGATTLNGGVTMISGNLSANSNLVINGGILESYWTTGLTRTQGPAAGQIQITGGESGFGMNGNNGATFNIGNILWGSSTFNPTKLVLQTAFSQGNSALTLSSAIDLNGSNRTIVANSGVTGAASSTISGIISNGTGTAGLIKEGAGLLILSAANTFNGTTTISNGILSLTNALALQNSALDTTNSVAGTATVGLRTNQTTLTLGGLIGNKDFDDMAGSVFTTTTAGYSAVTALTLKVGTGNTHSYSGAIGNGAATTSLTKSGDGTQILSGTNAYTGVTTVSAGTLQFAKMASLYNNTPASWTAANINVKSAATLALNVDSAGTAGFDSSNLDTLLTNISVANTAAQGLQTGAILGIDTSTATGGTFTQGNAITNSTGSGSFHGAVGLTKLGSGTLILDKTNTYTGTTTVNGGTLLINGSTSSTSLVTVNSGGTLGGTGTTGAITLNDGAFLSPGASIESLATGDNTWNGGSTFVFEFSTDGSTGTAGTEWDLLAITGELDLSGASIGNPINFDLITMADATTSGLLGTWNPNANTVWSGFVTTTGGITGFAANLFDIDITGFQNSLNGTFSVAQNGNNLDLIYTAVPEPRAALLGGLGLLMLLRRRRDQLL